MQKNDAGQMVIMDNAWLLAAIGGPLTLFTIALWWCWVFFTRVDQVQSPHDPEGIVFQKTNSIKRVLTFSKKRRQKQLDLEAGKQIPPSPTLKSSKDSWGSTITVKAG